MLFQPNKPWLKNPLWMKSIPGFVLGFIVSEMKYKSKLWQDSGKTTLATSVDHPVRVMQCCYSGLEITAPSDAARGLLKQGANGVWYIYFDGSNDTYQLVMVQNQPFGLWNIAALRATTGGPFQLVSNTGICLRRSGADIEMFDGLGLQPAWINDTNWHVIGSKYTAPGKEYRLDSAATASNAQAAGTKLGHFGTGSPAGILEIGSEAGARFAPINWAGCCLFSQNLSTINQTLVEQYLTSMKPT